MRAARLCDRQNLATLQLYRWPPAMRDRVDVPMDYYQELGISTTATEHEIRKAHHRVARLLHPDQQVDPELKILAEIQMMRMNGIIAVLLDPRKRREYDLHLHGPRPQTAHPQSRPAPTEAWPIQQSHRPWRESWKLGTFGLSGLLILALSASRSYSVFGDIGLQPNLASADSPIPQFALPTSARTVADFHFPAIGFDPRLSIPKPNANAYLIYAVQPYYPTEARENGVQGVVRFVASVSKNGTVESLSLTDGPDLLQEAAREAVLKWQYQPALRNGTPVPAQVEAKVQFRLP